ncbi:DUF305 domain-containing protein [Brevundimonas sp.]|uniref:DUF305 domain-containing protein n=1 Tax=Brevundimonas sp. TaxID=1871086 RepID=UPI0026045BD3|nr:DUF305 domain-containing protein [Brevundimonas sp.]
MNRISVILAACALSVACSPQQAEEPAADAAEVAANADTHGNMGGMAQNAAGDSVATRGYKTSMNSMMEQMPAFVGDADIDFMKQMRGHHQAAIAMARVELAHGKDAQARTLAQDVIAAQEREIQMIDAWLAQKEASAAPSA